jgi:GTP1/Obg family GTP-binding protein
MRYVLIPLAAIIILAVLIHTDLPTPLIAMNLWGFFQNNSVLKKDDEKTNDFIQQLEDKKENLAFVRQQIDDLTEGLKEMPDKNQNGYFRDLLTDYQQKEKTLEESLRASNLIERVHESAQEQTQEMNDRMEALQMRAQDQIEMMNDLMEQNQTRMEALMEKTNGLAELNQIRLESYTQRN